MLGLRLIVHSDDHYARFECPEGDSTFSLHYAEGKLDPNGQSLYFETSDVDTEYERLTKLGVAFDLGPTDQRWQWREAHLRDPDGHHIIIYHAGSYRKNPPWRITD